MIKTTKKGIKIEGSVPDILTNLTMIIAAVRDAFDAHDIPTEEVKDDVLKCVELAFMSNEEVEKEAMKKLGDLFQALANDFNKEEEEADE